ncbi:MAG: cytochrome P450 [Pyrinomonadaceae bacterium]
MPSGVSGFALFKMLPQFRRDLLQTFSNLSQEYGHIVRLKGLLTAYQLTHPHDIERVLQTNQQNYRKGRIYAEAKSSIGNGLLISEGDFWRRQRRLAQPSFHRQHIAGFAKIMTDSTETMLEQWQKYEQDEQPFDVVSEMKRLTLRIVGLTLFSTELGDGMDVISRSLEIARAHFMRRMWQPIRLPVSIPTKRNRVYLRAIRDAEEIIYRIIAEHRQKPEANPNNLLSMLLRAQDEETGESMSDRQLRDESLTIMTAGHETTAVALSWTWYLLSQHKDVERKLHAELADVLGGRTPTFEDLPNLKYTLMIIEEALRLYPPVWILGRMAIGDDEIGGYQIKAGSEIILSPYITHRHADFWDEPEKFNPERFSPEESAARPRFAYFPFGGGARLCIGNNFALMEAQLILATVAQKFRLRLLPDCVVEPEASFTLHPRQGIMMNLEKL